MFSFNEGTIDINNEWQDRSIILLTHPTNLSISIARELIPVGATFSEFVESQFALAAQQLSEYQEVKRAEMKVNNFDAIMSEFQWRSPQGKTYQISVIIQTPIHPIVITASSQTPFTAGSREYILTIIKSFKARQVD